MKIVQQVPVEQLQQAQETLMLSVVNSVKKEEVIQLVRMVEQSMQQAMVLLR